MTTIPTEPAYVYRARVHRVIDGDTYELMIDLGFDACSWWLGLDRQAFVAQAASQTPRMAASREAQWLTAYRVEVAGKAEQG